MTVLSCQNLTVNIGSVEICRDMTLNLEPGEFLGILGTNGVGKTTLLLTLAGLRHPQSGSVLLDNQPLQKLPRKYIARHIGLLLQDDHDPFPGTVLEAAMTGRHPYLKPWQWESDEDMEIVRMSLEQVGLLELQHRSLQTLSGGERRRLAMATLLTQKPDVLMMDEPTNHLDLHYQIHLLNLVKKQVQQQSSAMMVLHDPNLAVRYCDKLLLLFGNGETLYGETENLLTVDNLQNLYRHPVQIHRSSSGDIFFPDINA